MLHKFQYSGGRKVDLAYPPSPLTASQKQSWELETDNEPKWELGAGKAFCILHEPNWELELLSFDYKSN